MTLTFEGSCPLLEVFDMPTSLAFYCDVLGFEIVQTSGPGRDCGWAWLRTDDVELMLNTAYDEGERPPAPDAARVAAHADTTLYFGCRDLDGAYPYLRSRGVDLKPPAVQRYGMKQLTFHDPDGYGLCLQWKASA